MELTKMSISKWMDKKAAVHIHNGIFSSVQSLSRVRLFATPWNTARQASLSITNSQNPPKPMSIESVMPSNHLILCCPLLLLPSIIPSTMEYYSAIENNVFESVLMRWMKLEPIIQNALSERKTPIQYINTYIWKLERWLMMTLYAR